MLEEREAQERDEADRDDVDNSLGDQHSLERAAAAEAAVRAPLSPRHAAGSPPHAHGGAVCRSTCPQGDARVSGRAYTHLCALGCHSPLERTTTPLSLSLSLSLSHTQTRRSRVQAAEAAAEAAGRADLLRTRTVLTPPSVLAAAGVPVFRCVQPRASFVVLWPGAHAAGFSTGFNIAETTTLAPPDWLPYAPLWPLPTDSGAPEDNRRTHTAPSPAPPFAREDVLGWRACPHAQPSTPAVGCP